MRRLAIELRRHPAFASDEVADIVHDLWIELDGALPDFDQRHAFTTFAKAVLKNAAISLFRKRTALRRWPADGLQSLEEMAERLGDTTFETTEADARRRLRTDIESVDRASNLAAVRDACWTLPADLAEVAEHLRFNSISSLPERFGYSSREAARKVAELRSALIAHGVVAPE